MPITTHAVNLLEQEYHRVAPIKLQEIELELDDLISIITCASNAYCSSSIAGKYITSYHVEISNKQMKLTCRCEEFETIFLISIEKMYKRNYKMKTNWHIRYSGRGASRYVTHSNKNYKLLVTKFW